MGERNGVVPLPPLFSPSASALVEMCVAGHLVRTQESGDTAGV